MNPSIFSSSKNGLLWPKLIPGILIKRYKRFMVDVELNSGERVTAHCPNSGSMKTCCEPGRPVYLSYHDDPRRKLKYTWELIEMPTSLVGINTLTPNRLVQQSIHKGLIENLNGYERMRPEVKINNHTRLDILLSRGAKNRCFIEIKNCTLVSHRVAYFPDAVTLRGLKHLQALRNLIGEDCRGVIFFLIQRMDANIFRPADQIDPAYGIELRRAMEAGVEMMAYDVAIDAKMICLNKKVPCQL